MHWFFLSPNIVIFVGLETLLNFFGGGGTRVWNQGMALQLELRLQSFLLFYFRDRVSLFAQDYNLLFYTSCHSWDDKCTTLSGWDGVSRSFWHRWPRTTLFPIHLPVVRRNTPEPIVSFFLSFFFLKHTIFLCRSGWLWTCYVTHAGLKLFFLLPVCLLSAGLTGMYNNTQIKYYWILTTLLLSVLSWAAVGSN
jgi:hypothetical protein